MPRIPPPEARGDDAISRSVLAHQPEILGAFQRLYGTLWSHGVLDQATKEVARIRNARTTGCGYCKNVRFAGAREEGLTEDLVGSISDGFEHSTLSESQKAVIRYTDVFLTAPAEITPELQADMRKYFTAEQIVELSVGLALFLGFSKIAVALGQAPQTMPTTVIPTPDRPA
jgi:AhpD family alkylhydroperoxidase